MLDILATIDEWRADPAAIALATVVSTWGSSPRPAGAKMGIRANLSMVGSVSAGCVESAVLNEAVDMLQAGTPRLLQYGVTDETAWDVGLACGGNITIFVEPLDAAWWQVVREHVLADRAVVTVTVLNGACAGHKLVADDNGLLFTTADLTPELSAEMASLAQAGLAQRASRTISIGEVACFVDVHRPRPRLIIVGAAHTAQALAQMAKLLGFQVIIVDPRKAFATQERFPTADLISHEYPDKALPGLGLTPDTYLALLTHDPKIDDPALRVALPSAVGYIGILSSKRTHQQRIERLTAAGMDAALLDRAHTPIGLDIGAQSPEEIALSILAQIVAVRNGVGV